MSGARAPSGRASECAVLDGLVDDVRRGKSRSLVLRGEAGIGKTALLEYLVESASDLTVVRAVGVESEMELAFASLHQLCAPLLDRLDRLPDPQRQALEIVFGLSAGAAPDRFLVGLAVLSLLSEAAEERPLLCVVDDAQWLDQASALTLAFVARRLLAERVALVFAAREPGDGASSTCPSWRCTACATATHGRCWTPTVRFMLDERVRDRIIAETPGQSAGAARAATRVDRDGAGGRVRGSRGARRSPARIEESYVRRLEALPEDVRLLLLVAAAEPVGDPLLLLSASEQSRDRGRGSRGGDGRVAGARGARDVPSSAGALGGVSAPQTRRIAGRCIWRWRRPPTAMPIRIVVRGIWPRRRRVLTRRWLSSSSARQVGRRRAAGLPRRPRFFSARLR